jgi:hypothetical protein
MDHSSGAFEHNVEQFLVNSFDETYKDTLPLASPSRCRIYDL